MNPRHDYLLAVELLLSVLGRLLMRGSGWAPLTGAAVVTAWEAAASPDLLTKSVEDHVNKVISCNMKTFVPPKTAAVSDRGNTRENGDYKWFEGDARSDDHLQARLGFIST